MLFAKKVNFISMLSDFSFPNFHRPSKKEELLEFKTPNTQRKECYRKTDRVLQFFSNMK